MSESRAKTLKAWQAYCLSLAALMAGFIWTSFYPDAPFTAYSTALGILAASYFAKRYADKKYTYLDGYGPDSHTEDGGLG